ncbi:MAG: VOC family protein [Candidatus Limnocylindria bacterium]
MKVLFVAGFGPIVHDMDASLRFYRETIGMPLEEGADVSTARLLSPEGLLVGVVYTPWMREAKKDASA